MRSRLESIGHFNNKVLAATGKIGLEKSEVFKTLKKFLQNKN